MSALTNGLALGISVGDSTPDMEVIPVRFAHGPEGRVSYQVVGDGSIDLVFMPMFGRWNLDVVWEHPPLERFLRRLASFSRLILFNPRSTALSDPVPRGRVAPEDWSSDVQVVLDEVGSDRASIFAVEASSQLALFFAASTPERTSAMALLNGLALWSRADGYPWGMPSDVSDRFFDAMASQWGTGFGLDFMSPRHAKDARFREWWARLERLSMSAAAVRAYSPREWDMRGVLSSIQAPTLILSHADVPIIRPAHSRYLAERIPNASHVMREGHWDAVFWMTDALWVLDQVESFFTGMEPAPALDDRVLATVLFTDIVSSTERAAALGDRGWRELLDEHDRSMEREVERFRGRPVKSTGDGILATFDGPARAIRCGLAMQEAARSLGLDIRVGLHTGEIELRGDDVSGIAVVIAARVLAEAEAGDVLVSGAVPPLVAGSGLMFHDRGIRSLKGVPGEWQLLAVRR